MVHEVPDQDILFSELKSLLKPGGQIFIVEPKFHVTKKSFSLMIRKLESIGLEVLDRPGVFYSRTVLLKNKK